MLTSRPIFFEQKFNLKYNSSPLNMAHPNKVIMFSSGSSHYFFKRCPDRFGSQQRNYLKRVARIVERTAANIQDAVIKQHDLKHLFHDLLRDLGTERHRIAMSHDTESAEMYGQLRDTPDAFGVFMYTSLYDIYREHNQQLLHRIQNYLRQIPHTALSFEKNNMQVIEEPCLNTQTSAEISIFTCQTKDYRGPEYYRSYYEQMCHMCSITPLKRSDSIEDCLNHLMSKEVMALIREKSIEDYERIKLDFVRRDMYTLFPGKKSDWVLMTQHCEINGKMYALTQYLTWMSRNQKDDPVELMTSRIKPTIISLIHQDVFLIKETLEEIARLFKTAIEWDRQDQQELIKTMALFNYLFAHAMPFERGSASICEWLEMSIYEYHRMKLQYHQGYSINMEAFIRPLSEFVEKYPTMIALEPLDTPQPKL